MKDINDLRRARKEAAADLQVKAEALTAMVDGEDDAATAEAEAAFAAAEAAFASIDKKVKIAEVAEKAAAEAASGGDTNGDAGHILPARAVNPDDQGAEIGMMVHALANAKGDPIRAAARLEADGLSRPAAILNASTDSAGGVTIPRAQAAGIIAMLKARSVVRASGARTVPMPAGELRAARQASGATATYGAETSVIAASEPTFESSDKSFKKLTGLVPVSNSLLRQSAADVATFVRNDLIDALKLAEDIKFLRGDGTNANPKGLIAWALSGHKQAAVAATAAAAEAAIRKAVSVVEDANVSMTAPGWVMRASTKNWLASLRDAAGFPVFPSIDQNGTLKGFPIRTTSQLPNNLGGNGNETEVIFCDFNEIVIGDTQSISLAMSTEAAYVDSNGDVQSAFVRDMTLMRAICEHDIAPLHDEAIAVINGVSWGL